MLDDSSNVRDRQQHDREQRVDRVVRDLRRQPRTRRAWPPRPTTRCSRPRCRRRAGVLQSGRALQQHLLEQPGVHARPSRARARRWSTRASSTSRCTGRATQPAARRRSRRATRDLTNGADPGTRTASVAAHPVRSRRPARATSSGSTRRSSRRSRWSSRSPARGSIRRRPRCTITGADPPVGVPGNYHLQPARLQPTSVRSTAACAAPTRRFRRRANPVARAPRARSRRRTSVRDIDGQTATAAAARLRRPDPVGSRRRRAAHGSGRADGRGHRRTDRPRRQFLQAAGARRRHGRRGRRRARAATARCRHGGGAGRGVERSRSHRPHAAATSCSRRPTAT